MASVQLDCPPLPNSHRDPGPIPELRLRLLGPPRIALGDVPLRFKRRKAVAMLAYLAVTGRVHTREALGSLLARDSDDDDQAKTHLRNTLYALCAQVGDHLLLTRQTIALNPERPCWLDAVALDTALLATRDPATDYGPLERAVALYQGEFLAGFTVPEATEFEGWLLRERHRLHGLMVQAVHLLLARSRAQGDDVGMLTWARRLLAVEPWHEEAHRQIMRVLARTGQRAAALAQYETCSRLLAEELGRPPEPQTQALYDRLHAAPVELPHNVALPASVCVGRDQELATLLDRLEDPSCRLITLLGVGGSGKTSLALQAAAHYVSTPTLLDEHPFADGVYQVRSPGAAARGDHGSDAAREVARRLTAAAGRVLGLEVRADEDPTAQLLAWLRPKRLLLIVENGEYLQAGVAVLRTLVQQAPGVTLLVTSRERLQVPEEWVMELGGLALPRDADQLEQASASQLFLQQAQQAGMTGELSADDRGHIVRICQLTQGLPLALVLAARWRRGLSCAAIAAELERGIDLLATTDRGVPARHRSIRAVLAASWERHTLDEQAALRRLAVYQGGFTQEAAQAVAGAELAQLLALRDRVLLSCDEYGRYVLHELARRYAAEQLASWPDEERQVRARHAAYYANFVEQHAGALCQAPHTRDAIGREIANVRTAWEWAVSHRDVHLLTQMGPGLVAWYELAGEDQEWSQVMGLAAGELRTTLTAAGVAERASRACSALCSSMRRMGGSNRGGVTARWPRSRRQRSKEALALGRKHSPRNTKAHYLLRGLLRCPACGKRLASRREHPGTTQEWRYYRCTTRHQIPGTTRTRCCPTRVVAAEVEPLVVEHLASSLEDERELRRAFEELRRTPERERGQWEARLAELAAQEQRLQHRLVRAQEMREDGEYTAAEFAERKRQITEKLAAVRAEAADATAYLGRAWHQEGLWVSLEAFCREMAGRLRESAGPRALPPASACRPGARGGHRRAS